MPKKQSAQDSSRAAAPATTKGDLKQIKDDVKTLKVDVRGLKGDVKTLKVDVKGLKGSMKSLERRMDTKFDAVTEMFAEMQDHIDATALETRHYFEAVAENIHKDVVDVHADKIDGLERTAQNHEERITALEPTF